ncbi:MAG TPA: hypothetical protein VEI04_04475 [Syntrophobacteria bacterium]|nr:hypothetical protein [Syntrophobacteria bacterium]
MRRMRSLFGILLAAFLLLMGGAGIAAGACSKTATTTPAPPAAPAAAPKLVVDRGHGQTADVSGLTNVPAWQGCEVSDVSGQPTTTNLAAALANCSLFLVTQPTMDFTPDEVAAVRSYVESGGGLWVLFDAHGPALVDRVAREFGISFNSDMVYKDVGGGDWESTFDASIAGNLSGTLSSDPDVLKLFDGVTSFTYYEGASLNDPSSVDLVLMVSDPSQSDDLTYQDQPPILAATKVGNGRVVCIGDMTPLDSSHYAGLGDGNKQLLNNIVAWLKKPVSDPPNPPDPPADDPIPVKISIRPWCKVNKIDLNSKGFVRVAVITTQGDKANPDFDASDVAPSTVLFAGASPVWSRLVNVDRNKGKDLLLLFHISDLNLSDDATEATLTGQTTCGQSFEGTDSVRIIPKKKCNKPPQKGHDCGGRGK